MYRTVNASIKKIVEVRGILGLKKGNVFRQRLLKQTEQLLM